MRLLRVQKSLFSLIIGTLSLITASLAQSATTVSEYKCNCSSTKFEFLSGSMFVIDDGTSLSYDWTKLEFNFGKEGTDSEAAMAYGEPITSSLKKDHFTANFFIFPSGKDEGPEGPEVGFIDLKTKRLNSQYLTVEWLYGMYETYYFNFGGKSWFEFSSSTISSVPVPTSALMFAPALLGFVGFRRKISA